MRKVYLLAGILSIGLAIYQASIGDYWKMCRDIAFACAWFLLYDMQKR